MNLKWDIAPNIPKGIISLKEAFLHRVLVFSISGTYLVDLKNELDEEAEFSIHLTPSYLTELFIMIIKFNQRSKNAKA